MSSKVWAQMLSNGDIRVAVYYSSECEISSGQRTISADEFKKFFKFDSTPQVDEIVKISYLTEEDRKEAERNKICCKCDYPFYLHDEEYQPECYPLVAK